MFWEQSNGVQRKMKAQYSGRNQMMHKEKGRLNALGAVKWGTKEKDGSQMMYKGKKKAQYSGSN